MSIGEASRPGFEANVPRSGPRTAGFRDEVAVLAKERKRSGHAGRYRSEWAMKLFSGWMMSAGLVLVLMAGAANAQMLAPYDAGRSPYAAVSDFDGPYAAMPPDEAPPRAGPMLLPAREVYTVVRENGFSPLGIPQPRGVYYTIAVIDRGGADGWLVIDARNGRMVRMIRSDRMGDNANGELTQQYGPVGPQPTVSRVRGGPRPPASIPRVASRTPSVPIPKAAPPHADEPKALAAKPAAEPAQPSQAAQPADAAPPAQPPQQSAAVQVKPAVTETTPQAAAPAPVEAKPAATPIQPTQEMPKVQGLE
jgi:hypothetical protein